MDLALSMFEIIAKLTALTFQYLDCFEHLRALSASSKCTTIRCKYVSKDLVSVPDSDFACLSYGFIRT